jgi:hypothetical protein
MIKKCILLFAISLVTLSACNLPFTNPEPTSTQVPQQPTNTVAQPTLTNTPLPPPPTAVPTDTPTPLPPSPTPTNTSLPLNPTDAAATLISAPFASFCPGNIVVDSISPDANWVLCQGNESYWLVNKNGTTWEFAFKKEYRQAINGEIRAIYWSKDGYVFLTYKHNWDFGGISFYQTATLWRMNLSTGKVTDMVIPALLNETYWGGYAFAFSPMLKRLSYLAEWQKPLSIDIVNLRSGEQQVFSLNSKYKSGGAFAWSPDEQKMIVFLVGPMDANGDWTYYSVMYFNYEDTPMTFGVFLDEWHTKLSLHKINNDVAVIRSSDKHQWTFNFKTKALFHEVLP